MKRTNPKRQPQHPNLRSLARDTLSAVTGGVLERDDQLLHAVVPPTSGTQS
jgi:hypothetical protein